MKVKPSPSNLIIVNKKATAKVVFRQCTGRKYHLSTYMTSYDRKRMIEEIRLELLKLERDFLDMKMYRKIGGLRLSPPR